MKKTIKIIVLLFLIIILLPINSITASAVQLEILAQSPDNVNIGNSFDIVFSADHDTNIKAIRIKASYDSNYILFKSIDKIQSSEINYNSQIDNVNIIILFDGTLKSGDIFKLKLTAKTGNKSSKQKISFELLEAVDKDLKDASVKISAGADIEIIKKGEQSSDKENSSSNKSSNTASKNSAENFKSSGSSKSSRASSANPSSKSNSSRSYNNISKNEYSENIDDVSQNIGTFEQGMEDDFYESNKDTTTSVSQFSDSEYTEILNLKDSNAMYVFVGIGSTLSVMGILFAAFRMGQLSRRKPKADKIFPKDDNEDKW